jgi:hypothetical protein
VVGQLWTVSFLFLIKVCNFKVNEIVEGFTRANEPHYWHYWFNNTWKMECFSGKYFIEATLTSCWPLEKMATEQLSVVIKRQRKWPKITCTLLCLSIKFFYVFCSLKAQLLKMFIFFIFLQLSLWNTKFLSYYMSLLLSVALLSVVLSAPVNQVLKIINGKYRKNRTHWKGSGMKFHIVQLCLF